MKIVNTPPISSVAVGAYVGLEPSHQVFDALFAKYPIKALGAHLRLSPNTLGTWAHAPSGDSQNRYNPLDRIMILIRVTSDRRLCDWICHHLGGFFVANALGAGPDSSLHRASANVTERFAGILACIASAVADEAVSDGEAFEIRRRWEEVKSIVETFVVACENRNFTGINQSLKTGQV